MQLWQSTSRTPTSLLRSFARFPSTPFTTPASLLLNALLDDSDSIASNLKSYIEGFSANIQLILEKLLKFKYSDRQDGQEQPSLQRG